MTVRELKILLNDFDDNKRVLIATNDAYGCSAVVYEEDGDVMISD